MVGLAEDPESQVFAGWRGSGGIRADGFYRGWFRFNMLLGSFRGAIFCGFSALERQEEAKSAGELEVEGDFIAEECVVPGGFQGLGGLHGARGIRWTAGCGSIYENGLGLDYLELSPVGDGHGVDETGFDCVAGMEVGCETGAELDECGWGILLQ